MQSFSVLFVCKANMCRSPSAHAVLRRKLREHGLDPYVSVDSASTHDLYSGSPPDERSKEHAARRGYDLSDLRARHILPSDFEHADLILAMDAHNMDTLAGLCPPAHHAKLKRLTEFCMAHRSDTVPDPYKGQHDDFEYVLDLVEDACDGLIRHVRAARGSGQGR